MPEFQSIRPGQFSVSGKLTFDSVPLVWQQARKMLLDVYEDEVEIDIASVDSFDSSGIALMVAWSRWAHCNNKSLIFKNPNQQVHKLIEINKLQDVIKVN